MSISEQDVLNALRTIEDPDLHRDIVSLGFVQKPNICDSAVSVTSRPACIRASSSTRLSGARWRTTVNVWRSRTSLVTA